MSQLNCGVFQTAGPTGSVIACGTLHGEAMIDCVLPPSVGQWGKIQEVRIRGMSGLKFDIDVN